MKQQIKSTTVRDHRRKEKAFFLFSEQAVPHLHFALDTAKDVAGPRTI